MTHGSLFAGIGGFDLGFERAGIETVWQVEIDPFCRKVLEKHWPHVQRFSDIRDVGRHNLAAVDILSGGFPCQDISIAGKRAGITGERSGLWAEYSRAIGELRPRYIVVENVSALLGGDIGRVLGDLASAGYDAEWCCISAADMGAPHLRERIWIVAYPMRDGWDGRGRGQASIFPVQRKTESVEQFWRRWFHWSGSLGSSEVADTHASGFGRPNFANEVNRPPIQARREARDESGQGGSDVVNAAARGLQESQSETGSTGRLQTAAIGTFPTYASWWATEPDVGRVAHGVPSRVDRLKGLGNAVVPQIAEWIGRRIIEAEENK